MIRTMLLGIVTACVAGAGELRAHAGPDPSRGPCARSHGRSSSSPCRTDPRQQRRSGAPDPDHTGGLLRSLA